MHTFVLASDSSEDAAKDSIAPKISERYPSKACGSNPAIPASASHNNKLQMPETNFKGT